MFDNIDDRTTIQNDDERCIPKNCQFIISRKSRAKILWYLFNLNCYVVSYLVVPYSIAFDLPQKEDPNWKKLEIVLDLMILLDIGANFVTDRDEDPGSNITNGKIAFRYLRGAFVFDLLSCLPNLIRTYVNGHLDHGSN